MRKWLNAMQSTLFDSMPSPTHRIPFSAQPIFLHYRLELHSPYRRERLARNNNNNNIIKGIIVSIRA